MFISIAAFATPQIVRVDGSIFDASGNPITANKDIQIKAYDAASGGTLLWTGGTYNTAVSAGRFTINLDAASGSPSLVERIGERTAGQAIYFQVEVDSGAADGNMDSATIVLPRLRAKGTAFALASATTSGLRSIPVSTAVPSPQDVLKFDGTSWAPAAVGSQSYQTPAGSCYSGFASVDTRTLYMCIQGAAYYTGQTYAGQQSCPSSASDTAGTTMTSGFWSAQLATLTWRTCFKGSGSGCYQTTSGSCEGSFTQVDTYTLYQCITGSAFYEDLRPVESPIACPSGIPTTVAGSPPMSSFWASQVGSTTVRVCCK